MTSCLGGLNLDCSLKKNLWGEVGRLNDCMKIESCFVVFKFAHVNALKGVRCIPFE